MILMADQPVTWQSDRRCEQRDSFTHLLDTTLFWGALLLIILVP